MNARDSDSLLNNMDLIREVVSTPYVFPAGIVALVISFAVLVFVFGFKTAQEPPFDQLSFTNDDRKPAGKKRKLKDKKSQSNGHATTVKEKNTKASAKPDSGKATKQSPKQTSKETQKEQGKKKEAASPQQQLKEKSLASKKANAKQMTLKKSDLEPLETQSKTLKDEVDDNGGWEQVGKRNRKSSPPVSQDEKEKSNTASPVKEKKGKKASEVEVVVSEPYEEPAKTNVEKQGKETSKVTREKVVKETSPKPSKEKDLKEATPKPPKEKVSSATQEKLPSVKEVKESPKKTVPAKDIPKSAEKKPAVEKNVEAEFKIEEKNEKKKKTIESIAFIENEKSALEEEGKEDALTDNKVDGAVFDELGDVWTEKVPKKNKKKVRKE